MPKQSHDQRDDKYYDDRLRRQFTPCTNPSPPRRDELLGAGIFVGGDAAVAVGVGDVPERGEGRLRFVGRQPAVVVGIVDAHRPGAQLRVDLEQFMGMRVDRGGRVRRRRQRRLRGQPEDKPDHARPNA
jgi:hypothetical protein